MKQYCYGKVCRPIYQVLRKNGGASSSTIPCLLAGLDWLALFLEVQKFKEHTYVTVLHCSRQGWPAKLTHNGFAVINSSPFVHFYKAVRKTNYYSMHSIRSHLVKLGSVRQTY